MPMVIIETEEAKKDILKDMKITAGITDAGYINDYYEGYINHLFCTSKDIIVEKYENVIFKQNVFKEFNKILEKAKDVTLSLFAEEYPNVNYSKHESDFSYDFGCMENGEFEVTYEFDRWPNSGCYEPEYYSQKFTLDDIINKSVKDISNERLFVIKEENRKKKEEADRKKELFEKERNERLEKQQYEQYLKLKEKYEGN